jgi:amino acid permease
MAKDMMQSGKDLDAMEHGADMKGVQPSEPSRGTGTMDRKGNYFVPDSKRFNDQLPNSADQSAKWWYSAFHNTTAIVGAGVLGLPFAMKYLTWSGGVIVMCLSWITSLYTLWQLCAMHELDGHRFCRYHELGQYVFGPKLGIWMVLPCQIIMMVGLGIVYSVTGGSAMFRIYHLYYPGTPFGISLWILIFGICQIFISLLRNFNSLRGISFLAAVMSLGYSTIATGLTIHNGRQPGISYNTNSFSTADAVLSGFNSLGIIAFAYGGHNVILEIQSTLPSPPPTLQPYMRGVYIAYAIVSWCYFSVAFSGYWAYGDTVQSNILFSLEHPAGVIALASAMVLVHVLGSYQVYTVPVYDMLEQLMLRRNIKINFPIRFTYRTIYVLFTTFIAITLPFFGDLLGFIGAIATGPTTFWLPPLMWIILYRPVLTDIHCIPSYFCVVWGLVTTVLGAIGGLRGIINSASTYSFYQ